MKRICLVGCGRISQRHVQVLAAIPELEVAGVCDLSPDKARAAAEPLGVPWYTDCLDMTRKEKPDIVTIMTDSGSHPGLGCLLAPHVKVLVVEKPMALTLEDADRLIETCERNGTRLFVVKQNRFNPPIVQLRQAIDEGRFGKMVMGTVRIRWSRPQAYYDQDPWRGTWKLDGGVFTNQASHHIDLLQWLMGPVVAVKAYIATRLVDIEVEDTGVALLKFKSGALGVVEATTATRPKDLEGSLSILGETGSVVVGGFSVNQMVTWNFTDPSPGTPKPSMPSPIHPTSTASGTCRSTRMSWNAWSWTAGPCSMAWKAGNPWKSSTRSTNRPFPGGKSGSATTPKVCPWAVPD